MVAGTCQVWSAFLALIASGTLLDLAVAQSFGNYYLPAATSAPNATAFFPLTASSDAGSAILSEGGAERQYGSINGTASWVADSVFGYVFQCSKEQHNSIMLNPVQIGTSGAFAVNFWFKSSTTDNSGQFYAYLLSAFQNATLKQPDASSSVYETNSLQLMLPQASNNRSGIMRTVLKDNNDANVSSTLDSDGQYNTDSAWPSDATFLNVSNGAWHMATLTTRTDVHHGYALYMDGQPAAQLPPTGVQDVQTPAILGGSTYYNDGGDAIYLNGNVFLCARFDGQGDRFFSGSIAQVGFYNEALNASSIKALYSAVTSAAAVSLAPNSAPDSDAAIEGASSSSTSSPIASSSSPATSSSPVTVSPAVTDPRTSTVPDVSPATVTATDSSPASAAAQSHGLTTGAKAGIAIGATAGAVLIVSLAALAFTKYGRRAGHRRLQEAPSAKFLMHTNSMQNSTPVFADGTEGQNKLFRGSSA